MDNEELYNALMVILGLASLIRINLLKDYFKKNKDEIIKNPKYIMDKDLKEDIIGSHRSNVLFINIFIIMILIVIAVTAVIVGKHYSTYESLYTNSKQLSDQWYGVAFIVVVILAICAALEKNQIMYFKIWFAVKKDICRNEDSDNVSINLD